MIEPFLLNCLQYFVLTTRIETHNALTNETKVQLIKEIDSYTQRKCLPSYKKHD